MVLRAAGKALEDGEGKELVRRMVARELDPHSAAEEVVAYLLKRAGG
jgi:hypothetical protein